MTLVTGCDRHQRLRACSFQSADTLTTSDGSTWTPGTNIKTANGGFGAGGPTSCAMASMCAIVDLSGNGFTYAVPDTLAYRSAPPPAIGDGLTTVADSDAWFAELAAVARDQTILHPLLCSACARKPRP